ncbi:methyltransferase domain-containing protein [Oscillatoria sp. FACHB-1407]|uniref:methyltransferase domain-containing protein n=1 Tax=Oscillatoria sp. FACHB-1407 TaxID=2692847 RepID=UPI001685B651|nr:methyltransferase domain-containing protein [Oscillatoria sp. FACHB-1407]MBD2463839.1 methyltransferase domain-containing protein [Oscillatoria sp. FACHB-1407]
MKWNPADYAKNSEAQLKWARELLSLRDTRKGSHLDLKGHEAILDMGCGDGKITADFATALPQGNVTGIDSSPEMIAYATQTYPSSQYPNLAFSCLDARSLPFDRAFDLVFSNATLHWVDDHLSVLKGVSRALRDGGRLIISCGGQGNAAQVLDVFREVVTREPWNAYFDDVRNPYFFYGVEDYQDWLAQAGLESDRLELVPKDMTHPAPDGFAAWIRTTWMPITHRVPDDSRDRFIAEFVEAYLQENPPDSDGLAHIQMVRLEVDAHRPAS